MLSFTFEAFTTPKMTVLVDDQDLLDNKSLVTVLMIRRVAQEFIDQFL